MATSIKYNDFGATMIENRDFHFSLTSDDMTRNQWKQYLRICDNIASTGYKYLTGKGTFDDYRGAIHALFVFAGMDTRILALDAYVVAINRAIPYVWVKSKAYKDACKAVTKFKQAKNWALEVSGADEENGDAVLFSKADSVPTMVEHYFTAEEQDNYNLCIGLFKAALSEDRNLTVKDINAELERLEETKAALAATPKQYYKDYKNPMVTAKDKPVKHISTDVRKSIEDALADILIGRNCLTEAQLEKEEKQIKGGRK